MPAAKCDAVAHLRAAMALSERRDFQIAAIDRATVRCVSKRSMDKPLRERLAAGCRRRHFATRRIETFFATAFEGRVGGDQCAVLEDADGVGEDMDIEDAPPGCVQDAVEIAADADHAFVGSARFEPKHSLIAGGRQ